MNNPLLISMIVEISFDESFEFGGATFNTFILYKTFIIKKLKIMHERGEIVHLQIDKVLSESSFNVWHIHQLYALKVITESSKDPLAFAKKLNFEYFQDEIESFSKKVTNEDISHFGILQINSQDDFDFAHRTFAEFFVAQFLFDSVLQEKDKKLDLSMVKDRWTLFLFVDVWINSEMPLVSSFLNDNVKIQKQKFVDRNSSIYELSNFFNMSNFDFQLEGEDCGNLEEIGKISNETLNFRTIGRISTPFLCSLKTDEELSFELLTAAGDFLNSNEIFSLLNDSKTFLGENALMRAVKHRSSNFVNSLLNFTQNSLKVEQENKFLAQKNKKSFTALHESIHNDDSKVFVAIKKIYEKLFTIHEIKKSFLHLNNFLERLISIGSREMIVEVVKYLKELFRTKDLESVGFEMSEETREMIKKYV